MRVSFYLRNPKKKGVTAIYASICYMNKRVIVFPGESIDTNNWIIKKNVNKPKPIPENNGLVRRLYEHELLYKEVYDNLKKSIHDVIEPQTLKDAIYAITKPITPTDEKPSQPITITEFFQTLIDDCQSGTRKTRDDLMLNPNSIKAYKSAMNHFIAFQKKYNTQYLLSEIDQKLIKNYTDYLNSKLALNSSAKYLTIFKLLISYATEKKIIDFNIIAEAKVKVRREKSDNIYLTEKEIEEIMAISKFETPVYEVVRDYFVIACNTGLRFQDFSILKAANIKNEFIEIEQGKHRRIQTSVTKVIVPVLPMFKEILSKYPNGFPKCPPNQVFNRYIKEIAEQVPSLNTEFTKKTTRANKVDIKTHKRYKLVSAHTARRSFCTNMYLRDIPIPTIMALSGHKTEENFLKYIKADNQKHAEILKRKYEEGNSKG